MSSTKSSLFRKGNWSMVSVRVRATSDTQCGHQRRGPIRIQLLAWLAHRAYDAPSCFFQRRHHRQLDKIETADNCLSRRAKCHTWRTSLTPEFAGENAQLQKVGASFPLLHIQRWQFGHACCLPFCPFVLQAGV